MNVVFRQKSLIRLYGCVRSSTRPLKLYRRPGCLLVTHVLLPVGCVQSLALPRAEWIVTDLDASIDTTFPPAQVNVSCQSMILLSGTTSVLSHLVMIDLKLVEFIHHRVTATF